LATAQHAVMRHGLNRTLSYDGAAASLRGLRSGGGLSVTASVLGAARAHAACGDLVAAWSELGRHGDDYARSAAQIVGFAEGGNHDFLAAVVDAHWLRLVGADRKAACFDAVAAVHLNNYLDLVAADAGKLPNTTAIEDSYRRAVEGAGLPPQVAIDCLFSRVDNQLANGWLAKLGIDSFSWGAVCGMPTARIDRYSDVFADLDLDVGAELLATSLATIRRHPAVLMRVGNLRYPWNAAREFFR
jgi:hypothetical protein